MKKSFGHNLHLALIHYPVINKNGETIASAVTNLDLHDIARAAKTYGLPAFYVVTPLSDQRLLIERLLDHWMTGYGAQYNPARRAALELIRIESSVKHLIQRITENDPNQAIPRTVATSASGSRPTIGFSELGRKLTDNSPCLLLLGTAWGLANDFIEAVDYLLEPIKGNSDYNHLSVRSAAAIILDRLYTQMNT